MNKIPEAKNIAPMTLTMITGCTCLNMQTIIIKAFANINRPNCPDVKPKNLIGLFIFLIVLINQIIRKATIITATAMIHPRRYSLAWGLFVARE